jgi:hypothetical protein
MCVYDYLYVYVQVQVYLYLYVTWNGSGRDSCRVLRAHGRSRTCFKGLTAFAFRSIPSYVVLQWRCSGVAVVLQWCYSGDAVVLQWCYSGVTVVLQWSYLFSAAHASIVLHLFHHVVDYIQLLLSL